MIMSTKRTALQSTLWKLLHKLKQEQNKQRVNPAYRDSEARDDVNGAIDAIEQLEYEDTTALLNLLVSLHIFNDWYGTPSFMPEVREAIAVIVHELDIQINQTLRAE